MKPQVRDRCWEKSNKGILPEKLAPVGDAGGRESNEESTGPTGTEE